MDKHTKGPWILPPINIEECNKVKMKGIPTLDNALVVVGNDSQKAICIVLNSQANARLIAAAPELLEACKIALSSGNPETIGKALRQAIAKAEDELNDTAI